jgi:Tol biopolymer transport system component
VTERLALVVGYVLLCATSVGGAALTARNGDLLYIAYGGSASPAWTRLLVSTPDGLEVRNITPPGVLVVQQVAWSPDGRRIAIAAVPLEVRASEIYLLDADGSGLRRLTNNQIPDMQPAWSPDGRSIAFMSSRRGRLEIYSMRADGSRQRRLTDQSEDCESPTWSPNGRWIVASCQLGWWKLLRLRPDGSGERRLLSGLVYEKEPTFAPDGSIIFARWASRPRFPEIYSVRIDGTGLRKLSSPGDEPVVSPDGQLVAFTRRTDSLNNDLFVMRRDGTAVRQITQTAGVHESELDWQRR